MIVPRRCRISVAALLGGLAISVAVGAPDPLVGPPADEFTPSGLADYLERAQARNPGLEAFRQRYEAAIQRIPQAKSLPDPTLQVTHFAREREFMLSQGLPWFGKLKQSGEMASAEAEALWFAYQDQQLQLARTVAEAYYTYAYTHTALDLVAKNLRLLEELEPIVEEKVRGGDDLNSLLRLKVEIGKTRDRWKSLEAARQSRNARLVALLALPPGTSLPAPEWQAPPAPALDPAALMLSLEANNPALAMLEREVASAKARREVARLERWPDFTLGVNYMRVDDSGNATMSPNAGMDSWGVMVAVNLPIWQGKYGAARQEALAQRRAAESELANLENRLRGELMAALANLRDAHRRLDLYGDELLGLARQSLAISRTSYQGGTAGILEVIDSERSLIEIELLYWQAAADAARERVAIQALTNQPLSDLSAS